MYGIVLDAAAVKPFFALVSKEKGAAHTVVVEKELGEGKELFRVFFPLLSDVLKELKLDVLTFRSLLQYVAVGVGPGPFMGMRGGATIAKALCFAWKIPLVPFSSVLSFVPSSTPADTVLYFVGDAKQKQEYVITVSIKKGRVDALSSVTLYPVGEFTGPAGSVISLWPSSFAEARESAVLNVERLVFYINILLEEGKALSPENLAELKLCYFR